MNYSSRRLEFEGGRPLPRLMPAEIRKAAGASLTALLRGIPTSAEMEEHRRLTALGVLPMMESALEDTPSIAEVLEPIACATRTVEADLGASPRTEQTIVNSMRALLTGRKGVLPAKVFSFGEALFEVGKLWSSGLLTLALSGLYLPHAVGVIGVLIRDHQEEMLELWDGMAAIVGLQITQEPTTLASIESQSSSLVWSQDQHRLLRAAWRTWVDSRESTEGMPDQIRRYTLLWRAPINTFIEERQRALTDVVDMLQRRNKRTNVVELTGILKARTIQTHRGELSVDAAVEVEYYGHDVGATVPKKEPLTVTVIGAAARTIDRLKIGSRLRFLGYLQLAGSSGKVKIVASVVETAEKNENN